MSCWSSRTSAFARCSASARSEASFVDRVLEELRLSDRLLGGADADGGLASVPGADRRLRGVELGVGERDPVGGLLGVVGDGRERLGGVALRELGEAPGRGILSSRDRGELLVHARERLRGVLLELAQLVEGLGLLVQPRVGAFEQLEDLRVPGADLVGGVGDGVVQLLLERERLRQVFLGRGERLLELGGRGVSELGLREPELLLARLDRVIGLDKGSGCLTLELLDAHLRHRSGSGRLPRSARHRLRSTSADEKPDDPADHRGDQDEGQHPRREPGTAGTARPAARRSCERRRHAVGRRVHGTGPVVLRELRLDLILPDRRELLLGQGPGRVGGEEVLAALCRDREQVLVRAEPVVGGRLARPTLPPRRDW